MLKKRPTIRDVALEAGVSAATVSNVLNRRRNVDAAIAKRVHAAVDALGYRVDAVAANLRRTRARLVGLVVPDFQNPFFGELIGHMERLAEADGYRLAVMSSHEDSAVETARIEALTDWRAAGLILVPVLGEFASRGAIEEAGFPTVFLDRIDPGISCDSVLVNNAAIAGTALDHLARAGHRHILIAASNRNVPNMAERVGGALDAAETHAISDAVEVLDCGATSDAIRKAIADRLAKAPRPTAVLTLFNIATLETLRAVHRLGLTIPDDMSVVGFDDYAWMEVTNPPLTAVSQPIEEMARVAWARLATRLDGTDVQPETLRVPCALIERQSVAPPASDAVGS